MKKLTKGMVLESQKFLIEIDGIIEAIEENITNEVTTEVEEINTINEVIVDVNAWFEDKAQTMQDYFDERSEKWQESDAATEYEEWKGEFEEAVFDEIDESDDYDAIIDALNELKEALENIRESPKD
jgi:hypothetical protein